MTYRGKIQRGVVVFAKAPPLKDGTPVRVEAVKTRMAVTRYLLDTNHAETFAELCREGRPIPMFDGLIAAIARANHLVLLSADRHFAAISQFTVENWLI